MRISNITHNYTTLINKNIYNTKPESAQETETTGSLGIKTAGMSAAELTSRVSFGSLVEEENRQREKLQREVLTALVLNPREESEKKGYDRLYEMINRIYAGHRNNADVLINALQDPEFKLTNLPYIIYYGGGGLRREGSLDDPQYDKYRRPTNIDKIKLTPEQKAQVDYLESFISPWQNISSEEVNLYKYIKNDIQAQAMLSLSEYYRSIKNEEDKKTIPQLVTNIKNEKDLELFEKGISGLKYELTAGCNILKLYFDKKISYDIADLILSNGLADTYDLPLGRYNKEKLKEILTHYQTNYSKEHQVKKAMKIILSVAFKQKNPVEYAKEKMKQIYNERA